MCSPDLKVKAKKAMDMLMGDESRDEDERKKLQIHYNIGKTSQTLEDAVINRANDLYVSK